MSRIVTKCAALVLLAFLAGCLPTSPQVVVTPSDPYTPGSTPDLSNIAQNYPRVDGSTSTLPLQPLTACKLLDVPCTWTEHLPFSRTERVIGPDLNADLTESAVTVLNISHTGTHDAYMNLIQKNTDLILVARLPPLTKRTLPSRPVLP